MTDTFEEYQDEATKTAIYPDAGLNTMDAINYCALGLVGEAGEVAQVIKKVIRDKGGNFDKSDIIKLQKELGDVLWYASQMATECDLDLAAIAEGNIAKLKERQNAGTIGGSGDDR